MHRRHLLAFSLALGHGIACAMPTERQYAYPRGLLLKTGAPLPAFDLARLDGGRMSSRELLGSPTVITFFFADCPPCVRDVPALNAFMDKHPQFKVLAITHDTPERAARFKAEHGLRWPMLVEARPYFSANGVKAFPQFALLDAAGSLLSATYGRELGDERGTVVLHGLEAWVRQFT